MALLWMVDTLESDGASPRGVWTTLGQMGFHGREVNRLVSFQNDRVQDVEWTVCMRATDQTRSTTFPIVFPPSTISCACAMSSKSSVAAMVGRNVSRESA